MGTPSQTPQQLNKVVVGFLNGSRLKGYAYDFSPVKESFHLRPQEEPHQGQGTKVEMKDVKAIFFVRDFTGSPWREESPHSDATKAGRKIAVTFPDGEELLGRAEVYNPQKLGFFMFPSDPGSNNLRIFVISKNARQVKFT